MSPERRSKMNFHHYRPAPLPLALPAVNAGVSLARAESLRCMLDDADWDLSPELRQRGIALIDYLHRFDDLIPDDLPVIGHLDDALLIELSWSEFEGEVADHQDFLRFCRETPIRGTAEERRTAWESDCLAQANTLLHRQALRERGYARPELFSRPFRVC